MRKHDDDFPALRQAFPAMPDACRDALMDAARSVKEESQVKHRSLRVAVIAAALACLVAAACAAYAPQLTGLMGQMFGQDTQAWLEEGKLATPGQSIDTPCATFTLEEVIAHRGGLYGLATITPKAGSVLLPEDGAPQDAWGYDVHGAGGQAEQAPEGAPSYLEKAAESGACLAEVHLRVTAVAVDGGEALAVDGGYIIIPQHDGTLRAIFELEGGMALGEGETYTLVMAAVESRLDTAGEPTADGRTRTEWTVDIAPTPMEQANQQLASAAAPAVEASEPTADVTEQPAASAPEAAPSESSQGGPTITVPDAYTEQGTLPIYKAETRDFALTVQPEWFNQSGVAETHDYGVTFQDGSELQFSGEIVQYREYDGTWELTEPMLEDGSVSTRTIRRESLPYAIAQLGSWATFGFPGMDGKTFDLEKTELPAITLAEAQAQLEALLAKLGMEGYTCVQALDMSLERINYLGDAFNAEIDAGRMSNSYRHDYSQATEAEAGYYLRYARFGTDGDASSNFSAVAYVTATGIHCATLRDQYTMGDVYDTPASLVDVQTVLGALPKEMAASRYPEQLTQVLRATLTWAPTRAPEGDGMVLTPAWQIAYLTTDSQSAGYECWATFSAVDGTLLAAIFQ